VNLRQASFRIVNDTPLPLVCFTHPAIESGAVSSAEVARRVHRRGRAWISPTVLANGERVLRACITSHRTDERDLDVLLEELAIALN